MQEVKENESPQKHAGCIPCRFPLSSGLFWKKKERRLYSSQFSTDLEQDE